MGTDINLSNLYDGIAKPKVTQINEQLDDQSIRFVLPATIVFTLNQDDIEIDYTYEDYVNDIQTGEKESSIIKFLSKNAEHLAAIKFNKMNQTLQDFNIVLDELPNIKKAELNNFSFEKMLAKYKAIYKNDERNRNYYKD